MELITQGGFFLNDYNFKVNLKGMMDILSNHLYSSKDVFIRELLQNGIDAISMRKEIEPSFNSDTILIKVDENKSLSFRDNGIGLTEDELHKFLSVIGQSSKKDLQTGRFTGDYIGRFGIGLLSCFMVTDEILVRSRSVKTNDVVMEWRGKPDGTYSISQIDYTMDFGTEIILNTKSDTTEYFNEETISELVKYFGLPLPVPIILKSCTGEDIRLNMPFESISSNPHRTILELGYQLFGENFIDYIPLQSKNNLFDGVAYIIPYSISATAEHSHRIYLKNMLLTEDGSSILPKWAFFVRCFFNTNNLKPTASRESFYQDDTLELAKNEIGECISNYFRKISNSNKSLLKRIISIHSLAIKSIAVEDTSLFEIFIPYLSFETSMGTMYGKDLIRYTGTIIYTNSVDEFKRLSPIVSAQGELILNAGYVYDFDLIQNLIEIFDKTNLILSSEYDISFILDDVPLGERLHYKNFLEVAKDTLQSFDCDVDIKKFEPTQLPSIYILDEDAKLLRDIKQSKSNGNSMFFNMLSSFEDELSQNSIACLYFNYENTLVKKLLNLSDNDKLSICIEILYVQALLKGNFPLGQSELQLLNDGIINLIDWNLM